MSPHPRVGALQEFIRWCNHYGVQESWLVHQLTREIEVLQLTNIGVLSSHTCRGLAPIESTVLPCFGLAPEVLTG